MRPLAPSPSADPKRFLRPAGVGMVAVSGWRWPYHRPARNGRDWERYQFSRSFGVAPSGRIQGGPSLRSYGPNTLIHCKKNKLATPTDVAPARPPWKGLATALVRLHARQRGRVQFSSLVHLLRQLPGIQVCSSHYECNVACRPLIVRCLGRGMSHPSQGMPSGTEG